MQALTMVTVFLLVLASGYALYDSSSLPGEYFERQMLETYEGSNIDDSPQAQAERRDLLIKVAAVFMIISSTIGEVVAVWWFTVVLQCYHYFKDLNFRRSKQDVTMSFEAAKNFA
uniref:Uncharacterized protein n=1 Tax=Steinernema glaseri TaxID=37863 RepID=A0A1I8AN89_9BILA